MKPINIKTLLKLHACREQCAKFRKIFGEGDAPLTVETALAHAQTFDWRWAAQHLLTDEAREAYEAIERSARQAYKAIERSAWKTYRATKAPAWEAYTATNCSEWGAYTAITRSAWKTYRATKRSAREALTLAKARAFAEAYLSQE